MIKFIVIFGVITISCARPNMYIGARNVVTVPTNCPNGLEFVNGQCRDVWRIIINKQENLGAYEPEHGYWRNTATVPTNCKPGQVWVNGDCRDAWRLYYDGLYRNSMTVPSNCPEGQEYVNSQCRDVRMRSSDLMANMFNNPTKADPNLSKYDFVNRAADEVLRRLTDVPKLQCPDGQKADALGNCRPIMG